MEEGTDMKEEMLAGPPPLLLQQEANCLGLHTAIQHYRHAKAAATAARGRHVVSYTTWSQVQHHWRSVMTAHPTSSPLPLFISLPLVSSGGGGWHPWYLIRLLRTTHMGPPLISLRRSEEDLPPSLSSHPRTPVRRVCSPSFSESSRWAVDLHAHST